MTTRTRSVCALAAGALACLAAAGSARATDFPETEPNDTKYTGNVVAGMAPGDTITGLSTGTGTTGGLDTTADNFDITTAAAPAPGIYRYRLVLTTSGTAGHTLTIRGLTETAGAANPGSDTALQTASTTSTPPRFVQWYANEQPSRLYVRVTGSTTTTAPYTLTLERTQVTPGVVPGTIPSGRVFITTIGQTTADTDLWVYDANFNAIPGAGNDDETAAGGGTGGTLQSRLQRTLGPGTYYVAIANYNLANNQPLPADEAGPVDPLADFPNVLLTSSTSTNADNDFVIGNQCSGTSVPVSNTRPGVFDVTIWQFTLGAEAPCVPPPNDTCAGATPFSGASFTDTPLVQFATNDPDVSCNAAANTEARAGVWYRFTPPEPGNLAFTETGPADVIFTVFTGGCSSLTEVYCNTNEAGTAPFHASAGVAYLILVSLASDTAAPPSNYTLSFAFTADPGACCSGTSCTQTNGSAACAASGGTFQGYGVSCGGGPLPGNVNSTSSALPDYVAANGPVPVSSTITVTEPSIINDLDVYVTVTHTFVGDLYLRLQGPNGTIVDLLKRPNIAAPCTPGVTGDSSALGGTYVFDDDAATTLHAQAVATTGTLAPGRYQPSTCTGTPTSLDAASPAGFGGISAAGTWTLTVSDEDEISTGTLQGFGLVFNGMQQGTPCSAGGNGACCAGSTCSVTAQGACSGANTRFAGANTVCNAAGNNTSPCCKGDYNQSGTVTVQDIFDFLAGYFTQNPQADVNGVGGVTVQDIFDYLALYFTGC